MVGAALLKVIPLITGRRGKGGRRGQQIIARPTANPIIAGLMVSPVARAASAADPASLYRERNIPEHPRTVEAIIWSNARRALSVERSDSPKRATDARSWKIVDAL